MPYRTARIILESECSVAFSENFVSCVVSKSQNTNKITAGQFVL